MIALLTEKVANFDGKYIKLTDAYCEPKAGADPAPADHHRRQGPEAHAARGRPLGPALERHRRRARRSGSRSRTSSSSTARTSAATSDEITCSVNVRIDPDQPLDTAVAAGGGVRRSRRRPGRHEPPAGRSAVGRRAAREGAGATGLTCRPRFGLWTGRSTSRQCCGPWSRSRRAASRRTATSPSTSARAARVRSARSCASTAASVPWWRVIRASGVPADEVGDEQLHNLRSDGVRVAERPASTFARFRWHPDESAVRFPDDPGLRRGGRSGSCRRGLLGWGDGQQTGVPVPLGRGRQGRSAEAPVLDADQQAVVDHRAGRCWCWPGRARARRRRWSRPSSIGCAIAG